MISREIISRAINKAKQSICRFKISAVGLNKNGTCVASAINKYRFPRYGGGQHAEMILMRDAAKKGIKTIIICRVGKTGDILPIDPCPTCQKKAQELGIKIYSVGGR
jgi:cytidine deaminase